MYLLHQTYFLIQKRLEQKLTKKNSITFSQFLILLGLHCKAQASQTEIADFLFLTEATVSRHVAALQKSALLTRKEDPNNRRKHMLTLTPKGIRAFSDAHASIQAELKHVFDVIPKSKRKEISHSFELVLKQLLHK